MASLCAARLLIATISFKHWRETLGAVSDRPDVLPSALATRLAAHVEWAAKLLPFATKCLPRAMALSWMLKSRRIGHCVVFAVRPAELRGADDQLHAWVEVSGEIVLGDLPGPWFETLHMGDRAGKIS